MSCATRTSSSTVVSSATTGDTYRQMFFQGRGYRRVTFEPNSKKINQDAIPDTTHIDPKCVWGDEGPVNDQRN